jgi:hypothetical protein
MHPESPISRNFGHNEKYPTDNNNIGEGLEEALPRRPNRSYSSSKEGLPENESFDVRITLYDNLISQMASEVYAFLRDDYGIHESTIEAAASRYDALKADQNSYRLMGEEPEQIGYLARLGSYIRFLNHIEECHVQLKDMASKAANGYEVDDASVRTTISGLIQRMNSGSYFSEDKATRFHEDDLWDI